MCFSIPNPIKGLSMSLSHPSSPATLKSAEMTVTFSYLHTEAGVKSLESFISGKTYISGNQITKDDVKVYAALLEKPSPDLYTSAAAMEEVRASSAWVASRSSHVTVDSEGIEKVVESVENSIPKVEWNYEGIHYFDDGPLTVQYLFVLDALNFCFWPDKDLNYDDLDSGLKAALQNNPSVFDADRLQKYTGPDLRELLKWPRPLPLEDERVRLLHEVGFELERSFGGKASNIVEACEKSAVKLVAIIARHFPGFRDHTVYKGHQVFLYKRAQIFAADLYGAWWRVGDG